VTRTATTLIADQLSSSKKQKLACDLDAKTGLENKSLAFFSRFFIQKVIEAWKDCK
jgi:hypothetical protein